MLSSASEIAMEHKEDLQVSPINLAKSNVHCIRNYHCPTPIAIATGPQRVLSVHTTSKELDQM
jgi:hypothetical protein